MCIAWLVQKTSRMAGMTYPNETLFLAFAPLLDRELIRATLEVLGHVW